MSLSSPPASPCSHGGRGGGQVESDERKNLKNPACLAEAMQAKAGRSCLKKIIQLLLFRLDRL